MKDGQVEGIIYHHRNGRYYYNGAKPKEQPNDLPFEPTNDEAPY
jgi:hypothetical protein